MTATTPKSLEQKAQESYQRTLKILTQRQLEIRERNQEPTYVTISRGYKPLAFPDDNNTGSKGMYRNN